MAEPLKIVRDVLIADVTVAGLVGTKVAPLAELQGQQYPYVILTVTTVEPINTLQGHSGLDRDEVQVEAWAFTYLEATTIARACRNALQAAGHQCLGEAAENFDFQLDASVLRAGYVHQVWN
jgi:hypothetical protein